MFLLNSCLGHFSAAACAALLLPKLRSHFAEFLNNTSPAGLRILSSSTCVGLRYGPLLHDSGFSRQEGAAASLLHFAPHHAFVLCRADFPTLRLLRLHRAFHSRLCFPSRVPAVLITRGAGILNLLSIGYASLPLLRPRLTQSRSALLWKPWIFGRKDSHLPLATHSGILSSYPSTAPFGTASSVLRMLLYHSHCESTASVSCFSPGHFRRRNSRLVSCYALFECMAASEPTS